MDRQDLRPLATRTLGTYLEGLSLLDRPTAEFSPTANLEFAATRGWSNATTRLTPCAMKRHLRENGQADHPMGRLRICRDEPDPQRIVTIAEIEALYRCLDLTRPSDKRNLVTLKLAIDSGLRVPEMLSLKPEYLDMEHKRLEAKRKGGTWSPSIFSDDTAVWLAAWLKEWEGYSGSRPYVFSTSTPAGK